MASTQPVRHLTQAEKFERRLREHEEEVARLREHFGDPQLALFAFTRERFDRESLLQGARRNGDWRADDEADDDFLDGW